MRKLLLIVLLICLETLLFASCSSFEEEQDSAPVFFGLLSDESMEGKAYFDNTFLINWNENDTISVFRSFTNEKYKFDGKDGDYYGSFSKIDKSTKSESYSRNYALYPYFDSSSCTDTGIISFVYTSIQHYVPDTPEPASIRMVGATEDSDDNKFFFKNLCSYFLLKITGNVSISEIILEGNNKEILAGEATALVRYNDIPIIDINPNGSRTVTLDCNPGVVLDKDNPTKFWFVIPRTLFSSGFTLSIITTSGGRCTKHTSRSILAERNAIIPMATFDISNKTIDNQLEVFVKDDETEW